MGDIWLIVEKNIISQKRLMAKASSIALECARCLGSKVVCVVLGSELSSELLYSFASKQGYDSILRVDNFYLNDYCPEYFLHALVQLSRDRHPSVILFPPHLHFQDVAAHLAQILQVPCALDYDNVRVSKDHEILLDKVIAKGQEQFTLAVDSNTQPTIVVLRKDAYQPLYGGSVKTPTVEALAVDLKDYSVHSRLVSVDRLDIETRDLSEAEIIVAGGGGINTLEGWSLIRQLAYELGGKIAGSRAALLRGFITENQVVGISGKLVSPRLYIAIGISGCTEHLIGMKTAESIICVNMDNRAPIFNYACLGIVADLYLFLPELIMFLRNLRNDSI